MFRDLAGMSWKDFFIALAMLAVVGGFTAWGCSEVLKPEKPLHERLTDAECKARLDCWSAKHRDRFMPKCILGIERRARNGYVWHSERVFGINYVSYFPHTVWKDKNAGRFIWIGFGVSFLDANARLRPMEYECRVDPIANTYEIVVEHAD